MRARSRGGAAESWALSWRAREVARSRDGGPGGGPARARDAGRPIKFLSAPQRLKRSKTFRNLPPNRLQKILKVRNLGTPAAVRLKKLKGFLTTDSPCRFRFTPKFKIKATWDGPGLPRSPCPTSRFTRRTLAWKSFEVRTPATTSSGLWWGGWLRPALTAPLKRKSPWRLGRSTRSRSFLRKAPHSLERLRAH